MERTLGSLEIWSSTSSSNKVAEKRKLHSSSGSEETSPDATKRSRIESPTPQDSTADIDKQVLVNAVKWATPEQLQSLLLNLAKDSPAVCSAVTGFCNVIPPPPSYNDQYEMFQEVDYWTQVVKQDPADTKKSRKAETLYAAAIKCATAVKEIVVLKQLIAARWQGGLYGYDFRSHCERRRDVLPPAEDQVVSFIADIKEAVAVLLEAYSRKIKSKITDSVQETIAIAASWKIRCIGKRIGEQTHGNALEAFFKIGEFITDREEILPQHFREALERHLDRGYELDEALSWNHEQTLGDLMSRKENVQILVAKTVHLPRDNALWPEDWERSRRARREHLPRIMHCDPHGNYCYLELINRIGLEDKPRVYHDLIKTGDRSKRVVAVFEDMKKQKTTPAEASEKVFEILHRRA
ncbi:hypothetical protein QBC38DRAFT_521638 [Podospora fimiseda]|uniref:Uncharacterized protein n=1 Tax=Podospora fimiseda TaxID=252190 RepID=A0AAN7BDE2_9PEZI|nr:hypothetical protein QBC38DRAFT_521638 [Podospora fimiseda]